MLWYSLRSWECLWLLRVKPVSTAKLAYRTLSVSSWRGPKLALLSRQTPFSFGMLACREGEKVEQPGHALQSHFGGRDVTRRVSHSGKKDAV